jgi:putative glutamine amidotransferase
MTESMPSRVALTYRLKEKLPPYADALRAVGVEPAAVSPDDPRDGMAGFDGLLLSGGTDVNPARYGRARDGRTYEPDDARDDLEWRMLDQAIATGLPVLAICRGMQLFNVFHGGTLAQHIDERHRVLSPDPADPAHQVVQEPGTRLASILGPGPEPVNSRHHQAVETVGRGLMVCSRAAGDGLIEGLERPDLRFAVAVQWHPEDMAGRCPSQLRLFEAFAAAL